MKYYYRLIFILLLSNNIYAQDPFFVHNHSNAIYLNPALTGCFISPVISENVRYQWPDANATFKTYSTSYHQFVNALHGGIGVYHMHDNAGEGTLITDRINASYAVHFEIADKLVLRVGATGGYVRRKVDWDKLTFGDLIDPRYGYVYPATESAPPSTKTFFDCGIGTVAYMKNVYAGVAIDHLNQPDESFISNSSGGELPSKLVVNIGAFIPIGDSSKMISINPDIIYQKQRDYDITITSVTIRLKYILLGCGFRGDDNTMLMCGFENKFLRISYSYDWISIGSRNYDSHELSLSVRLFKLVPKKRKWTAINMEAF
jgi:type IX secretion system PorP/SprF family membrane protein